MLHEQIRKYIMKIKQLTFTSFPIFSQYEVLMALTDIGIISINTNMFTAMVNWFANIFIWGEWMEFVRWDSLGRDNIFNK